MTDYIKRYGKGVRKFQAGGEMPAPGPEGAPEGGAPAGPQGGADPQAMLQEYAQSRDPQLAVQICDMLVEMMAGAEGGAPPEGGGAPEAPQGPPAAANGGTMIRRNGGSMAPVFKKQK